MSLAAETIFMEEVIFMMFLVDVICWNSCFSVAIPRAAKALGSILGGGDRGKGEGGGL